METAMHGLGRRFVVVVSWLLITPAAAFAQGTIAGVVRDSSGAVLPGVTVEASSPALIEKVRSVITDGAGQYKIVDLRPGDYDVNFTLTGFATLTRSGVQISGSFTATINVELKVGSVQETVTVAGQSPLVDVQNVQRQRVIGKDVIDAIPTGRTQFNTVALLPGITASVQDVGGTSSLNLGGNAMLTTHGGRNNDMRVTIDGLSTANAETSGNSSNFLPNMGSTQEISVDYAAGAAELPTGGVRVNMIPREGGNRFAGSFFGTAVNSSFQGSNVTQELLDRGLRTPDSIKLIYDLNPSAGGPLMKDRLWWFASARWNASDNYVGTMFFNKNAGDPNAWTYVADPNRPAYQDVTQRSVNGRITWQINPRNKLSVFYDDQGRCQCDRVLATVAPEAAGHYEFPLNNMTSATWSSPLTSRTLLEVRSLFRHENWEIARPPDGDPFLKLTPVVDQATGVTYRGGGPQGVVTQPYQITKSSIFSAQAAVSYVTGAHAVKVGFIDTLASRDLTARDNETHMSFRFNGATPNQLTERATPYSYSTKLGGDLGVFAQDKWTVKRLTLNAGIRFDYLDIYFPETTLGPAPLTPTRNLRFPEQEWVSFKDITPRLGGAVDVFGNGKTAFKMALNKYVIAQGLQGIYGDSGAPANRLANSITRTWNDNLFPVGDPRRGNYVPDCDLLNPLANDECGIMSNTSFGQPIPSTTYDTAVLNGWNVRPNNWEFSTGVQHQVTERISAEVGYFRRWYGNFTVTDNRASGPANYTTYSFTAPSDPRLPGGGAYLVSGLYDLNPDKAGLVDNYFTAVTPFGEQTEVWHGVDLSVNARLRNGVILTGGLGTGRTTTDNCEVVAHVDNPSQRFCRVETPFLTQVKFVGVYTVPRVDVQVSGTYQSIPGPQILANYIATNALVQPSLGRPLSGNAPNVTVNLVEPGTMYGDRLNQVDFRFAKILRFNPSKLALNLDLYNAFNSSAILTLNNNFATWQQPLTIVQARFAKISVQYDF
jgi:hypothetical protein